MSCTFRWAKDPGRFGCFDCTTVIPEGDPRHDDHHSRNTTDGPELERPRHLNDPAMMRFFTGATLVVLTAAEGLAQPWVIPSPDSPPWCPEGTGCNAQISATHDGAEIHGVAHCRLGIDGVFDKPVVLLEGIDFNPATVASPELGFGDLHWGSMFGNNLTQVPLATGYRPMLDSLYARALMSSCSTSKTAPQVLSVNQHWRVGC